MSENDWIQQHMELRESLKDRSDVAPKGYYDVGYNSPWTSSNRRNEVWVERVAQPVQVGSSPAADSGDEYESDTEKVPYEVVESHDNYELRKYPASKWVCTAVEDHDVTDDYLKGWQDRYDSPMNAMRDRRNKRKDSPVRKMFKYLYQYISGVNKEVAEIEMTSPVTSKHIIKADNKEDVERCFWTGSPWENKDLPEPLKKEVYLQQRDEMYVFVRTFGGYALSYEDWDKEHQRLREDLQDQEYQKDVYYTVGYNSPWDTKNRQNEIWLVTSKKE